MDQTYKSFAVPNECTGSVDITKEAMGTFWRKLPDIFLPFRRASDYATRSSQGAGFGLSIAKRIARLAHGDIQVKSMPGHESTFIVTLPIKGGAG